MSPFAWILRRRFALLYVALAAAFVAQVAAFHDPETGFTPLLVFGEKFASVRLARLRDVPIYTYRDSDGYDGQFYSQVAVAGNPFDPELRTALDSPAYRSSRILLPLVAHFAGLGRPTWVLAAYALSNLVAWLILAWVTACWWFPPTSVHHLVRWAGTLFGAGMVVSTTRSLTEGPSLLLLAVGMRCLEQNRQRLAAGVLLAAGFVRETSVLAATAFVSGAKGSRSWIRMLFSVAVCVLPVVLWMGILRMHYGRFSSGALGLPGAWVPSEMATLASTLRHDGWLAARDEIYVVVSVLVPIGFLVVRPQPTVAWWRVGTAFAILALCRGSAFWDDPLTGVPRTLLPLTLAFNVLAPRTRGGLALLVAGNLTVLSLARSFEVVPTEQTLFPGGLTCSYDSGWNSPEHVRRRAWRWAAGSAVMTFHNPTERSVRADIAFHLRSETSRTVTLRTRDVERSIPLPALRRLPVHFGPFELLPGDTSLTFDTSEPPWTEPGRHGRSLTFAVEDLRLTPAPGEETSR
jgi:hypothetical protein